MGKVEIDKEKLRYYAEKATPGPWERGIGNESHVLRLPSGIRLGEIYNPADNSFISEANPLVIIELLDEIQRLDKQLEFTRLLLPTKEITYTIEASSSTDPPEVE